MPSHLLESLESRRLLSIAAPMAEADVGLAMPVSSLSMSRMAAVGTTINAEANQAFRAVIGTIRGLRSLPSGYTLQGDIDWGDGTADSEAQFAQQDDGSIAVIGAHTYANVGTDDITVVVSAVPPPGSLAPVLLVGRFHSKANVIASQGGVTLEETVGVSFTDTVGFFRSTIDPATMSAFIDWGDGTQSPGKIVELPTAGPVPTFAVMGSHAYSGTSSYLAHVTVYSSYPPAPTEGPPVILVAQFDSVIDVLPRSAASEA